MTTYKTHKKTKFSDMPQYLLHTYSNNISKTPSEALTAILSNGDTITYETDGNVVCEFSDLFTGDLHHVIRRQLDYTLKYAKERSDLCDYLMWKYEDEIVEYLSSDKYRDKHSPTTSQFITEQMTSCLESTLETLGEYINTKAIASKEDELKIEELKTKKQSLLETIKMHKQKHKNYAIISELEAAIVDIDKLIADLKSVTINNDKAKETQFREVSTDFNDLNVKSSLILQNLDENGSTNSSKMSDFRKNSSLISKKNATKPENIAKTVENAEKYLKSMFDASGKMESRKHTTPTELIERGFLSKYIDTTTGAVEWRTDILSEYKRDMHALDKALGYVDCFDRPTSVEYRNEVYENLKLENGYKANQLRKMRSQFKSQFNAVNEMLLSPIPSNDDGKIYHGDLEMLYMGDESSYKALLSEYGKLHREAGKVADSELKWLLWELDDLLEATLQNDTERMIISLLKQELTQREISNELNLSDQIVSKFVTQQLPKRLLHTYKTKLDDYVYTFKLKGNYKTCKGSGTTYLATDRYFRKDSKGRFGLRANSKEFESNK